MTNARVRDILLVEMLMTEKKTSSCNQIQDNLDEVSTTTSTQWSELLVNTAVPATVVAMKMCGGDIKDAAASVETVNVIKGGSKEKLGMLSNFQRRTFSRISFKGEAGPLLGRY